MSEFPIINDIKDDEIRIIGQEGAKEPQKSGRGKTPRWWIILLLLGIVLVGLLIFWLSRGSQEDVKDAGQKSEVEYNSPLSHEVEASEKAYTEVRDTTVNDIELRLYFPHGAEASLHVGVPDKSDSSIILIAQAADIRGDNGAIAGSYVYRGEVLAKGSQKMGFCAIIDGKITVGVDRNSPLFEQAIDENGYFFRQFSLVNRGALEDKNPKGKSIRRALCQRGEEIFMVETLSRESFHDFSQALVDIGMDNAIYLVGGSAYGWAKDDAGNVMEFGDENKAGAEIWGNINYIVWKGTTAL